MKRALAGIITLAVVGGVVWLSRSARSVSVGRAETPVAALDRMFSAASRGDVAAYVACFAGEERQRIDRDLRESPAASAQAALRSSVRDLKSWVVLSPGAGPEHAPRRSLSVERIYATRVERQRIDFVRQGSDWFIERVHVPQPFQPPIAYGTPIYEVPEAASAGPASKP